MKNYTYLLISELISHAVLVLLEAKPDYTSWNSSGTILYFKEFNLYILQII